MNKIKTLLIAFFLGCTFAISAQNNITSTEAHFAINGSTSREGLVELRTQLLAQGFDFRYSPKFDNQRHLVGIKYTITANDGALHGEGEHMALHNQNASITIHMNKSAGTYTADKVGE